MGIERYEQNAVNDSYVDVYSAAYLVMQRYPYRLESVKESSPTVASKADKYILDSNIGHDDVQTQDIIDRGSDIGAETVVPKDEIGDIETTVDNTIELIKELQAVKYDPDVFIPLQEGDERTHVDCYEHITDRLWEIGEDIGAYPIMVGGIKDKSPYQQIRIVKSVRDAAGDDAYIHGLGFGCTPDWIHAVHQQPDLLDSLDTSSAIQSAMSGQMYDSNIDQFAIGLPRGKGSTFLTAYILDFTHYMLSYIYGPNVRDEDLPEPTAAVKGLF